MKMDQQSVINLSKSTKEIYKPLFSVGGKGILVRVFSCRWQKLSLADCAGKAFLKNVIREFTQLLTGQKNQARG